MIRREIEYFFGAVRFFTRLPVPAWVGHSAEALNQSAKYFPAVGLLIGIIGALIYFAALQLWPQPVAVLLSMAATLYATGAFHEDGLADTVDGIGGGWDKARILEIMKDSRVGSYGVIATVLALLGKFTVLAALDRALVPFALLAGHALSRFFALLSMVMMEYARTDESSKSRSLAVRPTAGNLVLAALFVLTGLYFLPFEDSLFGSLLAGMASLWFVRKCLRWLGGYTGDTLGATQQLAEFAFYLGVLAKWPV